MASSLISINLLEWLTEFRETFYLPDYWFIIKGCNSETARWIRRARYGEWVQSFHALSQRSTVPESPHVLQLRSSPNPIVLGVYGGFIT